MPSEDLFIDVPVFPTLGCLPVKPVRGLPWDDNGNGRVSCAEARDHRIAPVQRGHPAYAYMTDGDGDGVVCE